RTNSSTGKYRRATGESDLQNAYVRLCFEPSQRAENRPGLQNERRPRETSGDTRMKWITRKHVKVDRVACPWLIRKFVEPEAEFYFVPAEQVISAAEWVVYDALYAY